MINQRKIEAKIYCLLKDGKKRYLLLSFLFFILFAFSSLFLLWLNGFRVIEDGPKIIPIQIYTKPDFKIASFKKVEAKSLDQRIIEAIITEAIGETKEGIIAAAWVFKNRLNAGMSLGSSGLDREDKQEWIARQPSWKKKLVKDIWLDISLKGWPSDPTGGALYFENVNAFGRPSWIDQVEFILTIGNHNFYQ